MVTGAFAASLAYQLSQFRWLLYQGVVLVTSMGLGIRWMLMAVRTFAFGLILLNGFLRVIWYYLTSPYILRHVRYSSSHVPSSHVKLRNLFRHRRRRDETSKEHGSDAGTPESVTPGSPPRRPDAREAWGCSSSDDEPKLETAESDAQPGSTAPPPDGLNNRSYLDVYYPVPVDELLRGAVTSSPVRCDAGSPTHACRGVGLRHARSIVVPPTSADSGGNGPRSKIFFPVIVCVAGGAWIVGSHFWAAMLARVMTACGFIVVSPDYRNFPAALIPHMIDDVDAAIEWTIKNIAQFHGDPSRIYLLGQSAGAHLTMMSMLRQCARLRDRETGTAPNYDPRKDIRGWIGLSGMYDLSGMADYLHSRGLYRDVLLRMCAGDIDACSALVRLQQSDPAILAHCMPRTVLFAHGNCDASAPFSESARMAAVFRAKLAEYATHRSRSSSLEVTPLHTRPPAAHAFTEDWAALPVTSVRLHTLHRATHTTPLVEDFLSGASEFASLLLALAHQNGAEHNVAPQEAAGPLDLSAVDMASLEATFAAVGTVSFTADTVSALLDSVGAGVPEAFLNGLSSTPNRQQQQHVTCVKFRPLVFRWQANVASFISAF